MSVFSKTTLKHLLGELPLTAELYWYLRQRGQPVGKMVLRQLSESLPEWRAEVEASPLRSQPGKRLLLFATLRYWIQHAAVLGLGFAGMGHRVELAYLPYTRWEAADERFDLRRQNMYVHNLLNGLAPYLRPVSFFERGAEVSLPTELAERVEVVAYQDTQYTLQIEAVDREHPLYRLRLQRNLQAAQAAWEWLQTDRPDTVIIPNGSIMEFGAVYQVARYLEIPTVTYEFGEQRERIWFDLNAEVMRQDTYALWQATHDLPFGEAESQRVRELFSSRKKANLWENFARRWQTVPAQGGAHVRQTLGLDGRPVVLLAANVIGDSLTLGRQVFSENMTDWLLQTARYFEQHPEVQFVIRIHPGERYIQGPSVADVIRQALPELPEHVRLVAFDDAINTYDLIQVASLGLVYTTTTGLEMAMSGLPVVVAGETHYRGRGFTRDPQTWDEYFATLNDRLERTRLPGGLPRLSAAELERAWHYAYRFFFDFPMPFPWHLHQLEKDMQTWSLRRVFSPEGQAQFAQTFAHLAGAPRQWQTGGH